VSSEFFYLPMIPPLSLSLSSSFKVLACEGDSKWTFFPGNYAEYEANRKERLGESSIKRITYAPLANA
jgi:hypothetical protein